jgi:hypothetical protein
MIRTLRRWVAAALLLALGSFSTGCFGSFVLVKKLYTWNERVTGNKFVRTLIFWVLCIFPIYQFAALGDAVVLNLIEFWTGHNPLAMRDGETQQRIVEADGQRATLVFADQGRSVRIEFEQAGRETQVFQFRGDDASAELRDGSGRRLSTGLVTAAGGVEVVDGDGALVIQRDGAALSQLSALDDASQLMQALRPSGEALACATP